MEFLVLGPIEVREGGSTVPLGQPRDRAVLAALLLRPGAVVSTETLVQAIWGDTPPANATASLQNAISKLRKQLGPEVLVTRSPGYAVLVDANQVDVGRFEDLVADGQQALASGDASRASMLLGTALGLWRGAAFGDVAWARFAESEAHRLEGLRLLALEERIEADLALGRHHALVPELESLVREHPLRERLREQLMVALYRSGRQADALDVYSQTRRYLVDELGLEPSGDLQRLEQAILRHDPSLAGPSHMWPTALARTRARHRRLAAVVVTALLLAVGAALGYEIGAHRAAAPASPKLGGIDDDFADGVKSPIWHKIVHGSGIDIVERNGRVEATLQPNARPDTQTHGIDAQFGSECTFSSDFDVQIDYELLDWPRANGAVLWLAVWYGKGYDYPYVGRLNSRAGREEYVAQLPGAPSYRATTDRRGTLRIARFGRILTLYVRQGTSWLPVGAGAQDALPATIFFMLMAGSDSRGKRVEVAWDSFRVNHGTPTCPI